MANLQGLPVELLLDNVLPQLALRDLLALASTSKFFTILINDDTFWQRKLEAEYNFTSRETARTTGWKAIYRGMRRPQVYVWGASSNGRLGRGPGHERDLVAAPVHPALKPKDGTGIVSLAAGGWSFHALDAKGRLYVWGQLDAENVGFHVNGFADRSETAQLPMRVGLDAKVQYVSCGRSHALAFDSASRIWHFSAWGIALRLTSPAFDNTTPDTTVVQLEAGWDFGAALTAGGSAYAWWHGRGDLARQITETSTPLAQQNAAQVKTVDGERVVPCSVAEIAFDPVHLPALPALPNLGESKDEVKLVKIAAADLFIVGLTNAGHVLKLDVQPLRARQDDNASVLAGTPLPRWEYLPRFSESGYILQHPDISQALSPAPSSVVITHISAHFHTFFAYSTGDSSVVLQGGDATVAATSPTVLPALQQRGVIAVVLGDYHWGALTAQGKLLTWGQFSSGALGLGDPFEKEPGPGGFPDVRTRDALRRFRRTDTVLPVEQPTQVDFGPGKFVIAATAAGWHTGALVLDLENVGGESEEVQELVEQAESSAADDLAQWQSPPFIPGGVVHPMPIIGRGRGGRGGLIGRQQPHLPVQPRQPQLQGGTPSGSNAPPRGGLHFRVGFAGRGAHIPALGRDHTSTEDSPVPDEQGDARQEQ
ncbi:RCC1/BLIP-II protein [Exidia glandulosa HHB12029]|uniref:RCC1/BLIP-II protein n=1 Tax=Exidia glandulosa HHB12029 TaxID=1314781 RepID=A0A165NV03_EXIGL|nr:RCC1/BLIP-II protein [Exidia glandulosa HHB12029]